MSKHLVEKTLKLMTVKELAKVLNVSTDLIKKRIRELFPDKMENGKTTYLTEKEVTAVKLRIQENSSLSTYDDRDRLVSMPKTKLEEDLLIQQAMQIQANRVSLLTAENEQLKNEKLLNAPKVALADESIRDVNTHYSITNAGKQIGLSQSKMFSLLLEKRLITSSKLPTQKALDKNMLSIRTNVVNGKNYPQAVFTMENIFNFKRVYEKDFK